MRNFPLGLMWTEVIISMPSLAAFHLNFLLSDTHWRSKLSTLLTACSILCWEHQKVSVPWELDASCVFKLVKLTSKKTACSYRIQSSSIQCKAQSPQRISGTHSLTDTQMQWHTHSFIYTQNKCRKIASMCWAFIRMPVIKKHLYMHYYWKQTWSKQTSHLMLQGKN